MNNIFSWSRPRQIYRGFRYTVEGSGTSFLLNDTSESRWIPTVIARVLGNTLINAALVLDGWLTMQHSVSVRSSDCLGCYFCSPG